MKASALSKELQSLLEEKSISERNLQEELGKEREEKDRIDREKEEFKFELELARNEVKTLRQRISTMTSEILALNTELGATKVLYMTKTKVCTLLPAQRLKTCRLQNKVKTLNYSIYYIHEQTTQY